MKVPESHAPSDDDVAPAKKEIRFSKKEFEEGEHKAKRMKDIDGNLYFDEEGKSIESITSSDLPIENVSQTGTGVPEKNLADQLIFCHQDYEDYLGSTYDKHVKLYKYYQVLTYALRNPKSLIYPSSDSQIINFNKLHTMTTDHSFSITQDKDAP